MSCDCKDRGVEGGTWGWAGYLYCTFTENLLLAEGGIPLLGNIALLERPRGVEVGEDSLRRVVEVGEESGGGGGE